MAIQGVDWETVLATREEELLTAREEDVDGLYAFLLTTPFGDTNYASDPDSLLKILRVVLTVFRVCVCVFVCVCVCVW